MNEETSCGDVQGFTKPLGSMHKRTTFKDFLKKHKLKQSKTKDTNVLQK